jgi:protein kinase-like protein
MSTEPQRTCPSCGNEFSGAMEFCPVCMLRKGLGDGLGSGESSVFEANPTREEAVQRFDNYELVTGEDGRPVELGRGAMGVTYKAFDVDLYCPVTLKVISERYLGDESAQLRFLREARAAATVRHPNVASVLHLGRTDQNYFYAMEFVEGETLQNLIKRNRSDIVIERQTLQGLRTTVNLSQMDAAPLGLQMFLVSGSSGRERQKLGVSAKAR